MPDDNRAILTCAVGFEDLVRGDLMEQYAVRSRQVGPGEVSAEQLPPVLNTMIDTVALPWDGTPGQLQALVAPLVDDVTGFRVQVTEPAAREELVDSVAAATGWVNRPGDWQVNLDPGRGRVELGPLAWAARFGRMRRLPATTPPTVAAGLLRLAKLKPGMKLLDPCGGVASIPIIDAIERPEGHGWSIDADNAAIADASANVAERGLTARIDVRRGDATALDLADLFIDRVVSDLPFGKKVGTNQENRMLYPAILKEVERVLAVDGRAVLLTDDKRFFEQAVQRARGLKVVAQRIVRYNNVTPTAYVLRRSRKPRR
ncbi:hypothetical protein [Branchiibius sp. NY16-3462-2]|uniref:methyltransferase domain-containing protein n=1 Tax=Branchiibius sp. NY16-3462-2 TaxID=1807500 RepID=UPI000798AC54|nr:hypothetical protein [Branchiibius sp. NY16-3462-2]KYH45484.1 hypothetical protein AZH51_00810 [Branchiibius sp. NY16-3462-2]